MKSKPANNAKPSPEKNKFPKKTIIIISGIIILILILFRNAVFKSRSDSSIEIQSSSAYYTQGKTNAEKYCQSCHLLPDPGVLDKETWKTLLPQMGLNLGIHSPEVDVSAEQDRDFYPAQPAMDDARWQSILAYYNNAAPTSLTQQEKSPGSNVSPFFSAVPAPDFLSRQNLMATYVKIDNSVKPARLFVFDENSRHLFLFNKNGFVDSVFINGVISDISFINNEILVCSIGSQVKMGPDKEKLGTVFPLTINKYGKMKVGPTLFKNLARPVQILPADLNGDHQMDYVICEFGKLTGSLTWMENQGAGKYLRHVIRGLPGSVKVYAEQNKQTGLPDLWVLFAQGDEGIFHFINKGKGQFEEKRILRFPPVYGSTSFEMADINNDGFKDIAYTCGDNGDGTRILKPYHGIYVFMNDGKNNFEQKYFYPLNGCYKVVARDFENNGKVDLAAIGYFTNPAHPEEWFVYLKNNGAFNFTAYGPPKTINFENALTLDAGDFNGDGKPDLIAGNELESDENKKGPMFVVFESLVK